MFHINSKIPPFLFLILMRLVVGTHAATYTSENIWFDPPNVLLLPEGSTIIINWFTTLPDIKNVSYHVEDEIVGSVKYFNDQHFSITVGSDNEFHNTSIGKVVSNYTYMGTFEAQANFIGFNKIYVTLYNESEKAVGVGELKMTVSLSYQKLNDIFTIAIGIIVIFLYIAMGATLDMDILAQIIKKPIGPIIGLICQYVFMPLIAYSVGVLLFPEDSLLRLGLFLSGCSPGGGLSNMWTHLLGGSLDLSIMMTFISTIAAFGIVPLWTFTMGPIILNGQADFAIPYKDITIAMASLAISCVIGLVIQRFLPRVAKVLKWLVTPFSIAFLIFILTFGAYSYRYCFIIATWKMYLAGFALPFIGYCSGALAAVIFKRNVADVVAIAIETGIQNNSVAIFILKFTLESPAGELTAIAPAASTLMNPITLVVAVLVKKVYDWKMKTRQTDITKDIIHEEKQCENGHRRHGTKGVENPTLDLSDETV